MNKPIFKEKNLMRRMTLSVLGVLAVLSLLIAACAPVATPAAEPTAAVMEPTAAPMEPTATADMPEPTAEEAVDLTDPANLSGDIYTAGSSTVGPLTEAVIEQFIADGFSGQVKNDIIGSGAGFERFCTSGESDISNASRAIKDSEVENCGKLSPPRTPVEFLVALDAMTVVVNNQNDWVTDVTSDELVKLFTSAEKWSDVNPDWPTEPILRYTPGTDSGTYDFFVEVAIQKTLGLEEIDEADKLVLEAKNLNLSEDDNVLVQGVEGNKYAIGYFGYAYYVEEGDNLKALNIDGIEPNEKTAEDGSYLLARPLYIYSDADIMKAKPQVAGFIRYYLENVDGLVSKVGYFPASQEALDEGMAALDAALK
jgi:phosphate transport system substrate-binding protein